MEESAGSVVLTLVKPPEGIAETVATLACPTPTEIDESLEVLGVRGQPRARAAVATLAWSHVHGLRQEFVAKVPRTSMPGRRALLLTGPTGSGKTLLVELLCREVLDVPGVVVDVASLAESDCIEQAHAKIFSRLLDAAGGNKLWASMGVVCLDGLDRIASPDAHEPSAKGAPDWALRNWRVQRALHAVLTTDSVRFHYDNGFQWAADCTWFPLARLSVVACGNLSGDVGTLLPELLGAFGRKVELDPLATVELRAILDDLVHRHRREIGPGFTLDPSQEELDGIVGRALEAGLGARGLRDEVEFLVESVVHPREEGGNR